MSKIYIVVKNKNEIIILESEDSTYIRHFVKYIKSKNKVLGDKLFIDVADDLKKSGYAQYNYSYKDFVCRHYVQEAPFLFEFQKMLDPVGGAPTKDYRVGETRMMNCGMKATIIAYRGTHDIDVEFEDGMIIKGKEYQAFRKGQIYHPENRFGESKIQNNGHKAVIINYIDSNNMDARFDNGYVVKGTKYNAFKKGQLNYPKKLDRLGEKRMMNCGMEATIVRYGSSLDIDVEFVDGTLVKNREYGSFKRGSIRHPKN